MTQSTWISCPMIANMCTGYVRPPKVGPTLFGQKLVIFRKLGKSSDGWCCFGHFDCQCVVLTRTKEEKHGGGKRGLLHTTVHVSVSLVNSHVSKHHKNTHLKTQHFSVIKTPLTSKLITKTASGKLPVQSLANHVAITSKRHNHVS